MKRTTGRTSVDLAIDRALHASLLADDQRMLHLPLPVRYRAAGAVKAWKDAYHLGGDMGRALCAALADPEHPALNLINLQSEFAERHSSRAYNNHVERAAAAQGTASMCWQLFWQRKGVIYEPTPALWKLLDQSDISDNVPVGMLRSPSPALCLLPGAGRACVWGNIQAILMFQHRPYVDNLPAGSLYMTVFAFEEVTLPAAGVRSHMLTLDLQDEGALIDRLKQMVEQPMAIGNRDFMAPAQRVEFWKKSLDCLSKMLLYLSLDDAQVLHEPSYSAAPRMFPGLGKRRREQKLTQIEQLYDRYVVGPALAHMDGTAEGVNEGPQQHGVSAHWRRGHFRMQAHGLQAAQRKLIFIAPTIVRADLLPAA